MIRNPLASYFLILVVLCVVIVTGTRVLGQQGAYLIKSGSSQLKPVG
jgi:hypothetical protein